MVTLNLHLLLFDQRNWHQLAYRAPCIGIRRSVCRTKLNFVFLSLQLRGISKSFHFVFLLPLVGKLGLSKERLSIRRDLYFSEVESMNI